MGPKLTIRGSELAELVIFWAGVVSICIVIGAMIDWTFSGLVLPAWAPWSARGVTGAAIGFYGQRIWRGRHIQTGACRNSPDDDDEG